MAEVNAATSLVQAASDIDIDNENLLWAIQKPGAAGSDVRPDGVSGISQQQTIADLANVSDPGLVGTNGDTSQLMAVGLAQANIGNRGTETANIAGGMKKTQQGMAQG